MPSMRHFSYEFIMEEPSEPEAQIVLNAGSDDHDVYIDNVSLKQVKITKIDQKELYPNTHKLHQNYPNPFNPYTTIKYNLQKPSNVVLNIYNLYGQKIRTFPKSQISKQRDYSKWLLKR